MSKHIAIRVDSSSKIGFGHLARCLVLAKTFRQKGFTCFFICQSLPGNGADRLMAAGFDVEFIPVCDELEDARCSLNILSKLGLLVSLLIVDHYQLARPWEDALSSHVYAILAIDDLANRKHQCRWLLDVNIHRAKQDYIDLCPDNTECLIGVQYACIDEGYPLKRTLALARRKKTVLIQRLLVTFGATDPIGLTPQVLTVLNSMNLGIAIDLVASSSAEWFADFNVSDYPNLQIILHINPTDLSDLVLKADLALGSIGTSTWERACMGLPSIVMLTSELQRPIAEALSEMKVVEFASCENLDEKLGAFFPFEFSYWWEFVERSSQLISGRGPYEVMKQLIQSSVDFRPMNMDDMFTLFEWQGYPESRRFSRNPEQPSLEEHQTWYKKSLIDPQRRMWMVECFGQPAGYIRLDETINMIKNKVDESGRQEEVSILISRDYQGMGLGKKAIHYLIEQRKYLSLLATVHDDNQPSKALFLSCGFESIAPQTYLWSEQ